MSACADGLDRGHPGGCPCDGNPDFCQLCCGSIKHCGACVYELAMPRAVEGDMRVRGKEIQEYYRGEWVEAVVLESDEKAREMYAALVEYMRAGRLEV